MKEKLQLADLAGNLLEHLVVEGTISYEEQDKIIQRIAKANDFAEHTLYNTFTVRGTAASRAFFRIVAKAVRMRRYWPDDPLQGPDRKEPR